MNRPHRIGWPAARLYLTYEELKLLEQDILESRIWLKLPRAYRTEVTDNNVHTHIRWLTTKNHLNIGTLPNYFIILLYVS